MLLLLFVASSLLAFAEQMCSYFTRVLPIILPLLVRIPCCTRVSGRSSSAIVCGRTSRTLWSTKSGCRLSRRPLRTCRALQPRSRAKRRASPRPTSPRRTRSTRASTSASSSGPRSRCPRAAFRWRATRCTTSSPRCSAPRAPTAHRAPRTPPRARAPPATTATPSTIL